MQQKTITKITSQLEPYGYTLSTNNRIVNPSGEETGATVTYKSRRFYTETPSGHTLWSGPDLSDFLEAFWFAKRKEP